MLKTKPEYRVQALGFAKKNGFDKVHFQGMIDDFEVYTGDYNETRIVGLPQVIFADEKTVDFAKYDDPFRLLDTCKRLPKVVFEYDCMCWFGNSFNLKLLEDGRLVRLAYGYSKLGPEDRMCEDKEYVLLNSPTHLLLNPYFQMYHQVLLSYQPLEDSIHVEDNILRYSGFYYLKYIVPMYLF